MHRNEPLPTHALLTRQLHHSQLLALHVKCFSQKKKKQKYKYKNKIKIKIKIKTITKTKTKNKKQNQKQKQKQHLSSSFPSPIFPILLLLLLLVCLVTPLCFFFFFFFPFFPFFSIFCGGARTVTTQSRRTRYSLPKVTSRDRMMAVGSVMPLVSISSMSMFPRSASCCERRKKKAKQKPNKYTAIQ